MNAKEDHQAIINPIIRFRDLLLATNSFKKSLTNPKNFHGGRFNGRKGEDWAFAHPRKKSTVSHSKEQFVELV
jgi:hypothetical protein